MQKKKEWQDNVLIVAVIIATIGMVPAIVDPKTYVPLLSSVPTFIALSIISYVRFTLGLKRSAIFTSIISLMWLFLAIFRS